MKKKIVLTLGFLLVFGVLLHSQIVNPVSWSVSAESLGNSEYVIKAVGTMESSQWHIYDMQEREGGPNRTSMVIEGPSVVEEPHIVSKVQSSYDDSFGMKTGICPGPVVIKALVRQENDADTKVTIEWQACKEGMCLPPDEYSVQLDLSAAVAAEVSGQKEEAVIAEEETSSLWTLILEAVAWGLVALLTPCVFPMIPLIVSFFLKQNGKSPALFFGLSIIVLYTVPIAVLIAVSLLTGGQQVTADIFNFLATHWIPNLLFFVIFMIFAASFFGAFNLELPSGLADKVDSKAGTGGMIGAFFVALTLVIVSFSCTGPIVGSVLIKSTRGQIWEPVVTMFAFSVAFALPFTLFAFAPSLLKKLPKSGGWLNSVKVVLGFIELALGFKFLSVADQTYHWGLLDREVYLSIWIVIFSLMGFYLLGKIKFRNDGPLEYVSVTRLGLSIATFAFVVYMIPGLWGAPLKALSGYLPPISTQDFIAGKYETDELPSYTDYALALSAARSAGKPLFVDFTGHGCVNCREMEARVWSDPRVHRMLRDDFVLCRLYSDDKKVLPEEEWVTTDEGKVLKSVGKINSYLALKKFNVNAQPYYTILDPVTEKAKTAPRGYSLDVDAFISFLEAGLR